MLDYGWPGNVRELMNRVERASALAEHSVIGAEDLTLAAAVERAGVQIPGGGSLKEILRDVEVQVIEQALRDNDQVMAKAARQLGMSRQNLYARMRTLEPWMGKR
jgi:DNA-binding NtrC family response regulator